MRGKYDKYHQKKKRGREKRTCVIGKKKKEKNKKEKREKKEKVN